MLNPTTPRVLLAVLSGLALLLMAAWLSGFHAPICEGKQSNPENCHSYNLAPFILIQIYQALDSASVLITAFATIAIAWFTWTLYGTSKQQGEIAQAAIGLARDDFNATHRPWIAIADATPAPGFVWIKGNAIVGFEISYKNVGNSPAQRVLVRAEAFPFLTNEEIPNKIEALKSKPISSESRPLIERALFPNTPVVVSKGLFIPEGIISELKDYLGHQAVEIVPVIIGVIEYYFPFGQNLPHYTPFVYHVWRTDKANRDLRYPFPINGSRVDPAEIIFVDLISAGVPD